MSTKDRILDTALELFNAQGSYAVSTNHIAEALEMSPGNLYYHFKNKEEIVRSLFERLDATWDELYRLPEDQMPTLDDLEALVSANFGVLWQYRFFYRELIALTQRDPQLAKRYQAGRRRGFEGFAELLQIFTEAGVMRTPQGKQEVMELAHICWMISDFWLAYLETGGEKVSPKRFEEGVALLRRVLEPYRV